MGKVTVEEWKEMFRAVGLSDADMKEWHTVFEGRNPDGHQSFLEWLGLDAATIKKVRSL